MVFFGGFFGLYITCEISIISRNLTLEKFLTGASMQARSEFSSAAHPATLYPDDAQHAGKLISSGINVEKRTEWWGVTY